jgi:hypothetical protein
MDCFAYARNDGCVACKRATLSVSSPAKAGDPVNTSAGDESRSRSVLDRPVKPDDDSSKRLHDSPAAVFSRKTFCALL